MQGRKLLIAIALLLAVCFCEITPVRAASDDSILLKKSQLLVSKGKKAEERGEIEEAVASYEEAYNLYPKNILPLLLWGKALCRIGMYQRARELLEKIPLEKLPDAGQSEVHLLMGRIALAIDSIEAAAAHLSKAVKASKDNYAARLRLAMVNQMLGMNSRAEELMSVYESFAGFPQKELVIAFFLDLQLGNLGRSFSTSGELVKYMTPGNYVDEEEPFLSPLWKVQPITFLTLMPLSLGVFFAVLYFLVLFGGLVFIASRLSPPTAVWHDLAFVVLSTGFMVGAQAFCRSDLFLAAMSDHFSANDSTWIVPRLIISGHLIAIGLYAIFPVFRFLPEEQRPKRFEYYGIWFFCWFFMIFVLVFQSRIDFGVRMGVMCVSACLAFIASFFMPLGKYILYKISNMLGMGSFAEVSRKDLKSSSEISFTDAKILESKAVRLLEADDWQEVILIARKVQANLDKKTFPTLWKAMIFALIAREDYIEAQKSLAEFLRAFANTSLQQSGELLDAYLKVCRGDFAGALKIIRNFPEDKIKAFTQDETALSLLIIGKCDLFYKENVQAHIDLNKAFTYAKMPLIKAESLVEIIELDFNMRSLESINKWKSKIQEIKGGDKCASLKNTINSIVAMANGQSEDALKFAEAACKSGVRNGRAYSWYGHLLCLSGKFSEAEELLEKMTPDSAEATRLMTEITGS
ncbi:MAG: hypothetical protein Kow0029_10260 [Candidatus Rifleibacteriota bacterium]